MDQFLGSGSTLIEAKLLERNAIGVDINPNSIKISNNNLEFPSNSSSKIFTRQGNAAQLTFIKSNSIDLICTHPPYADIIRYSQNMKGDISHLSYEDFLLAMVDVTQESFRVLKNNGICAVMIGDIRKKGNTLPLGMNSMQKFIEAGFIVKEIIIKEQHNCRSTQYWNNRKHDFLLLAHEYIFIFEKLANAKL